MENKYLKYCLKTGEGLQEVDGLKTSKYFKELSNKCINNELSFDEAYKLINSYYDNKEISKLDSDSKEADLVANNIASVLQSDGFTFTVGQLLSIHKSLFTGIFEHAGKLRDYNFSKKEWVLDGESISYGDYKELENTLAYDFSVERSYNYKNKTEEEIITHLADFISNLWQIHPFQEGNTRTTAVFFIKYLKTLGFDVTNDAFINNAWYFRNALVRSNYNNVPKQIYSDKSFLILFLRNLLLKENNVLENKLLSIKLLKTKSKPILNEDEKLVITLIKEYPNFKSSELSIKINKSIRTVKTILMNLQNKKVIKRINGKRYGYWKVNEYDE